LDEFPLFVKGGIPIPMQEATNRMTKSVPETLSIRIYPGKSGCFTLYEDDGISRKYENGEYLKTKLRYENQDGRLTLVIEPKGLGYSGMPCKRAYRIEWMQIDRKMKVLSDIQAENSYENGLNIVQTEKVDIKKSVTIVMV
jgi:alpha-glucosidase (family GH31 glycosyl hydrolase)